MHGTEEARHAYTRRRRRSRLLTTTQDQQRRKAQRGTPCKSHHATPPTIAGSAAAQAALKAVASQGDFRELEAALAASRLELRMRRRSYRPFEFTVLAYGHGDGREEHPEFASYLIDDGVSSGKCRWSNLHRVMQVVES